MNMNHFKNPEPEVFDVIDDGSCEGCKRMGVIYEAVVYVDLDTPGFHACLCARCLRRAA
jgi:hypothetical protein